MTVRQLIIRDLDVAYGSRGVISGLGLPPFRAGEIIALVGPNAAGKSTLLRALAGLVPYSGRIEVDSRDLAQMSREERARLVTYMPQTPPGGSAFTVLESVIGAIEATSGRQSDSQSKAVEALETVGALEQAGARLDHLSGGQRQLAGLAQAIARDPAVLLLDEPTSALDLKHQLRVMKLAIRLATERPMIVVMVLHDLELACRWATRIAVLHDGRSVSFGPPNEVVTSAMLRAVYDVDAEVSIADDSSVRIELR